ncbi:MAG: hypothetical protein HYV52_01640 [Parcubacteria group bacterium]|nr:hypothetical protein [Parcubacteria group bacterium]
MAKKNKNQKLENEKNNPSLHPEVKKIVISIIFFTLAVIFLLSAFGLAGRFGGFFFEGASFLLGKKGFFMLPTVLFLLSFSFVRTLNEKVAYASVIGGVVFKFSFLGFFTLVANDKLDAGGYLGMIIADGFSFIFGFWASSILFIAALIISFLITINMPIWRYRKSTENIKDTDEKAIPVLEEKIAAVVSKTLEKFSPKKESLKINLPGGVSSQNLKEKAESARESEAEFKPKKVKEDRFSQGYKSPPLDILTPESGIPSQGDISARAQIIKRTLENFGIEVEMSEVNVGPTVTQYTLKPAEGVKLSRITALNSDLSLALAAYPLRIEAPIPGRSLVGIEIPNRSQTLVRLRNILENPIFVNLTSPLAFALGRDVAGSQIFADLAKMPHLLVAGATGAGKSVSIHSILTTFLWRNSPETLRLLLIDPKRVELGIYNGIPHLLSSTIIEPKKAVASLRWAASEMERRYVILSDAKVRDIEGYNRQARKNKEEIMPYLVIVIDELADLMASYPREVEGSIIRIAQMARAVGMHLIVSTQRPSVEVVTGLIKANITSRIAFQVASLVDSRTILDMAGAEKLLGRGDMLYLAGDASKPKRIQSVYVSEEEAKKTADYIGSLEWDEAESKTEDFNLTKAEEKFDADSDEEDEFYEEAKDLVIEMGKASASLLQRRLRVGYARAARLLDIMETRGIIGPGDGAKPREILVVKESNQEMENEKF